MNISILFLFFVLSFFITHNLKAILHVKIRHTNDCSVLLKIFLFSMDVSILFLFFILSFFITHNLKAIMHVIIIHTNDCSVLLKIFLFWFGLAYKLQLVSHNHQTVPQYARHSCADTSLAIQAMPGVCKHIPGMACIAIPGLLNLCVTSCDEFAHN